MKVDRDPFSVNLIAVTKTVPIERIAESADAGIRLFGENRIQEAEPKVRAFREIATKEGYYNVEWHFIGHLQSNKVRKAVGLFDVIHSVDSVELAETINREAERIGKIQKVFIQVKLSHEQTKHGVAEEGFFELLKAVSTMENLNLVGLMTLPPYFEDPELSRPYFRRLAQLRDEAQARGYTIPHLSMGMSHDCEVAIEEGATYIRVGTALFGQR